MKGYWLVLGADVTDPEAQAAYGRLWTPIAARHGARVIRSPSVLEAKELRNTSRVLLIEFPDLATARACYDDPDYRAAIALAQRASTRDLVIFEADFPNLP